MSYKQKRPIPIAEGGTNATVMATTDGTVYFDGTRLVTSATGTANQVLTSNGAGFAPTYQNVSASGAVTSVSGGNNITIGGTATAPIVNVSGTTDHAVQVGNATNSLTSLTVGTNGQVLLGSSAANPSFVTPTGANGLTVTANATTLSWGITAPVSIANGGTNATSMATTDGTVYFNGTSLVTTATGTSGWVLTSGGAGVAPAYAAPASSSISITGDTGGALTGNAFTFAGGTTGLSFGGSGSTETLTFAGITANGGTVSLATDATTSTINVGTGAGVKTSVFGSTNSTSATTVQSGSGALNVTATGGALTINSGVGALGISTDSSATTISIGTGAAVKGVTLGSTNTTSSTAIKSGSGNVAINSGLTIDSTGRNYNAAQPAFLAFLNTSVTNVTGDGTNYTIAYDTEKFDQGSNFATGTFTAPIAGQYFFNQSTAISNLLAAHTGSIIFFATTNAFFYSIEMSPGTIKAASGRFSASHSVLAHMDAADTCTVRIAVGGSTKTVTAFGASSSTNVYTWFSGNLVC